MTYLDGSPGDCLSECLESMDEMTNRIEALEDALGKIHKACTHEWLEDKDQKSNAESQQRMFMACVKDCRRISKQALKVEGAA